MTDRIVRLNKALLAFRVGLYTVIIVVLVASPVPANTAIVIVGLATFIPALPFDFIRPRRVEVGRQPDTGVRPVVMVR